ncbi:MATE family efflux transporter [Chondromyces apiculatus]|nr:MATE family efflux transporter [Chondromyces apiculatus]
MTQPARPPAYFPQDLRRLLRLAGPIALAQAGITAMTLIDTAIVGRMSVKELAAASMGRAILFASGGLSVGVASAIEPLAAQALGAGEVGRARSALGVTLQACLLMSAVSVLLGFLVTLVLVPMGIDADLVPGVRRFMLGHVPATFCYALFSAGRTFLQVYGRTRPAIVAVLIANVVNFLACSVLVRGDEALAVVGLPALGLPQLGALGAGLSASIGGVVLVAVILRAAASHGDTQRDTQRDAQEAAHPDASAGPGARVTLAQVLRLGTPAGMQILIEGGVFSAVALVAGKMGIHAVSAHQVAIGLASFSFMSVLGVSSATAVAVGYAVGAGRPARRPGLLGITTGGALMTISALIFTLFPRALVGLFTEDPEVIAVGVSLMRMAAIFQIFDGVQAVATGALRGAGDTRVPFVATVMGHWLVGFPLALLCGFVLKLGAVGLWMGLTAGLMAVSVLLTGRFIVLTRGVVARV